MWIVAVDNNTNCQTKISDTGSIPLIQLLFSLSLFFFGFGGHLKSQSFFAEKAQQAEQATRINPTLE